jgi:hypothetical protein
MRTSYLFKVEIVDIITHFAYKFWLIREIPDAEFQIGH